jgi:hypothetical protein
VNVPPLPGTYWTFYTDAAGKRAVLTIELVGRKILFTTSAGERLLLSPTELAMLMENLESAASEVVSSLGHGL